MELISTAVGVIHERHTRAALAAGITFWLMACFEDAPVEPDANQNSVPAGLQLAASATGTITDLGTFGGDHAQAEGINKNGEIVGTITKGGLRHAFLLRSGTVTHVGPDRGDITGDAINDNGVMVGGPAAYSWRNGTVTPLATLPNPCSLTSFAVAVNTNDQIVGWGDNSSCQTNPLLWENGSVRELGKDYGTAWDINDNGQVVGYLGTAFVWEDGAIRHLGTLGGDYSQAFGINNSGHIVGESSLVTEFGGQEKAFLWANGVMKNLGTLGGRRSSALDINDNDVVVGHSTTATGDRHAFWWKNGVMSDLGTLGGDETVARAINGSGVIVGWSNANRGGRTHAVRWTIPTANYWSARAPGPARSGHAQVAASGLLYVIGGNNNSGTALSTVQTYNPATDSWSSTAPLPSARGRGNGAATINGTIYLAGGQNSAGTLTPTLFAYNISTNAWTTKANMPVPGGCGGSAAIAGKLYVYSGCTLQGGTPQPARVLHRYDPGSNSWITLRPPPAIHSLGAVAAVGGKLYLAGGNSAPEVASARLDVYDPATNTWSSRRALPTARVAPGAAVVGSLLYVIGGRNGPSITARVDAYDPRTDSWSQRARVITPRAGLGAGAIGGLIYAVAGRNSRQSFNVNERYTP